MGGQTTNIPLKVNTAGVIPVIFASSIMSFPSVIAQFAGKETGTGIGSEILEVSLQVTGVTRLSHVQLGSGICSGSYSSHTSIHQLHLIRWKLLTTSKSRVVLSRVSVQENLHQII